MCFIWYSWSSLGIGVTYFDLHGSNLCVPTLILPSSLLGCYLKLIFWNIHVSVCNDKTMLFVTHSLCRPKENHQSYIGGNIKLELFILTWNRKKWSSLKEDLGVTCQSPKHKPNTVGKINVFYMVISWTIWSFLNAKMPWVTKILGKCCHETVVQRERTMNELLNTVLDNLYKFLYFCYSIHQYHLKGTESYKREFNSSLSL